MTAAGVILLAVSFIIYRWNRTIFDQPVRPWLDEVAGCFMLAGMVCTLAGVFLWLWMVMP